MISAACLCLAAHINGTSSFYTLVSSPRKSLYFGSWHTIFKSRTEYDNENNYQDLFYSFFFFSKMYFERNMLTDNDFDYRIDVFKKYCVLENAINFSNLSRTNTFFLVASSQMAASSKLEERDLKPQKLYFSLTWSTLRAWVLLNCFLTQSRPLTLIPGMLEMVVSKFIYHK